MQQKAEQAKMECQGVCCADEEALGWNSKLLAVYARALRVRFQKFRDEKTGGPPFFWRSTATGGDIRTLMDTSLVLQVPQVFARGFLKRLRVVLKHCCN